MDAPHGKENPERKPDESDEETLIGDGPEEDAEPEVPKTLEEWLRMWGDIWNAP